MLRGYDACMDRSSDTALVERLMCREESALRDIIDAYSGVVYGIARRVVADPMHAEEVAQDAFLALWRRPGAYDPARGSLRSFLLGVARNKAIDLVRREESQKRTKDSLIAEVEATSAVAAADEQLAGVDERQEVRAALVQLTSVQREAVVLAYFGGRTYREVAAELEIPEGTAKTRLRDGLLKLRSIMSSCRGS